MDGADVCYGYFSEYGFELDGCGLDSSDEDGCDGLVVTNLSSGFFKSFVIN